MNKAFRYRAGVASRAIAAIGGGYAMAALSTAVLALLLPLTKADAVMASTMLSFTVYACAVIWVFAAPTALRAWIGLVLPAILLGLVLFFSRSGA